MNFKKLLIVTGAAGALIGTAHAAPVTGSISIEGNLVGFGNNDLTSACTFTGDDTDQDAGAGEAYLLTGSCTTNVENNNERTTGVVIDLSVSEDGTTGSLTVSGDMGPLAVVNGNDVLDFSASIAPLNGTDPFGFEALLAAFDGLATTVVATVDNPAFPQVSANVTFDTDLDAVPLPGAAALFIPALLGGGIAARRRKA